MTRRDTATAPWTARQYRQVGHPAAAGNRPYDPARQIPVAELAATRATVHHLAQHADRRAASLLQQAVTVLDEAVRGCERRAARAAGVADVWNIRHAPPATRTRKPRPVDVAAARAVVQRMLDGGELLTRQEGASLVWALPLMASRTRSPPR